MLILSGTWNSRTKFDRWLWVTLYILYFLNTVTQVTASKNRHNYSVLYKWKTLDFKFPTTSARRKAFQNGAFIPANNVLSTAKVWENQIYLAVGRFRPGVPVTLARASYNPASKAKTKVHHKLEAYPNWAMQQIGNCDAFQFVQSVEIDQSGRMWVIDAGLINLFTDNITHLCPPKLVIIALATGAVLRKHIFPPEVASRTAGFLDDIVVACKNPFFCYAYITDTLQNTIIVYDYFKDKSWAVTHKTMIPDPAAGNCTANGVTFPVVGFGVNGIGLSPFDAGFARLYYSPVSSFSFYSVATGILNTAAINQLTMLRTEDIQNHGVGLSQTDGHAVDSGGILYHSELSNNTLARWDTNANGGRRTNASDYAYRHSDVDMEFIDSASLDNQGHVLFISNKLGRFLVQGYDVNDFNIRILRTKAVHKFSYMFRNL